MTDFEPLTITERRILRSNDHMETMLERIGSVINACFLASFALFLLFGVTFTLCGFLFGEFVLDIVGPIIIVMWIVSTLDFSSHFIFSEYERWKTRPTAESSFAVDLKEGVAAVQRLNVRRVFELHDYEDEGLGFLLELDSGGVLCLINQDFYQYASDIDLDDGEEDLRSEFPQTVIEYRHAPNSGLPFSHKGIGESLRPTHKIPGAQKMQKVAGAKRRRYVSPEDGIFYPGPLEKLCESFGFSPQLIDQASAR